MRGLSRRGLLGLAAAGLLVPSRLAAAPLPTQRKLLLVYAPGGWDITYGIAPMSDVDVVVKPQGAERAVVGAHAISDHPLRPAVRSFFEMWGDQVTVLHGVEVRSVTHDACRRLILTGSLRQDTDDWGVIAGAHGDAGLELPHVVVSGPAYASRHTADVARVGQSGQLPALLDGSALQGSDRPVQGLEPDAQAALDAYLSERVQQWTDARPDAQGAAIGDSYESALFRVSSLRERGLQISAEGGFLGRASVALDCLQAGVSRSAMVDHRGFDQLGWDSHGSVDIQGQHHQLFFDELDQLFQDLAGRPGETEPSLLDETLVVVFSEMSRFPTLNPAGGKDHWTWTSLLLAGAGVQSGRSIGGYDQNVAGLALDLDTAEPWQDGVQLSPGHVGATLLAALGVDPGDYTDAVPITGLLR